MNNITPWAEDEINKSQHWLVERQERQRAQDTLLAKRNLDHDNACADCGYVECSCPELRCDCDVDECTCHQSPPCHYCVDHWIK